MLEIKEAFDLFDTELNGFIDAKVYYNFKGIKNSNEIFRIWYKK